MSIAHEFTMDNGITGTPGLHGVPGTPVPRSGQPRSLHRIAEARRRQGVSLRSVARRLNKSAEQVRHLEEPTSDMLVSELYEWQQALEVPIVDLLLDCQAPLSEPVLARARLLKIMKTVRAIRESTKCVSIDRMAAMLEQQLVEIMPELKDVSAWHSVGQRRSHDELGRTAERTIPDSFFTDSSGY
jgi:transcriptional regulator with XRE-family HTH domain